MNLNILHRFRHEVYSCFERAADALFNTADALLTETDAHSFPELALSPCFQRQWPSLYEAFEDGRIDYEALMLLELLKLCDSYGLSVFFWRKSSVYHITEAELASFLLLCA